MPTQEKLKQLHTYDPETGIYYSKMFKKPIGSKSNKDDGLKTKVQNKYYRVHRLIWMYVTGEDPGDDVIDHINGDPYDNRWCNLRRCSVAQNHMNRKLNANSTSGFKGVTWAADTQKWQSQIGYMGVIYYLGQYDTPDEAHDVYLEEAEKCFGEYMREL